MKMRYVGAILLATVVLAGCSHDKGTPSANEQREGLKTETQTEMDSGTISSIMGAMGLGKTMECTYKDANNSAAGESKVVVQGENFRSTTLVNGETTYAVSNNEAMFVWTEGKKEGWKMTKACLAELEQSLPQGSAQSPAPQNPEKSFETAQDVSCRDIGSADFSVPSDVTFADQCAMMQQGMEMMKNMQQSIPSEYGQ